MDNTGVRNFYIPLRVKFIVLFLLLITVPFTFSGIVTYRKYSSNVEKSAAQYSKQLIEQTRWTFDRYIKDMDRLTSLPLYDDSVMKIMRNHSSGNTGEPYMNTEENQKMSSFLWSMRSDRPEIEGILLFYNDGLVSSSSEYDIKNRWNTEENRWNTEENRWMEALKEAEGKFAIIPPHDGLYYSYGAKRVISVSREIREPYTLRRLGIIKIDLTSAGFEKILATGNLIKNGKFYISDRSGTVFFPFTEVSLPDLTRETVLLDGKEYLNSVLDSDYTGLRFSGLVLVNDLKDEARNLISFTAVISLISLIVAYFLAIFFADRLVKPIQRLQRKMKQFREGDFGVNAKVTTRDEIGNLTESFNKMVQEINRLVKEVYEVSLREREAELIALQSQINPHFIYNTLETISMIALNRSCVDLSDVVTNLGKLLRYTVQKSEKPVFLKDEILFVQAYLNVQSFRLGDRLNSEIYIDTSFETCLVPKLILQPFVENAIEHAMGHGPVTVRLRASVIEDDLYIYIQDDGVGMSADTIRKIEERVNGESRLNSGEERGSFGKVNKGYALRNVHQRLRLLYGKSYGVHIDKDCRKGSVFYIRLPFQWGEQDA